MNSLDPRRPVIVAVGQHTQRTNEGANELEPAALIAEALVAACADAGRAIASSIDSVRLIRSLSARAYRNAPLLIAQFAGVKAREYTVEEGGGETPGAALARACDDIAAGRNEAIAVVGGEAWNSRTQTLRHGRALTLTPQADDVALPITNGSLIEFVHPAEQALGIERPIQQYPLFENALRARLGHSVAEHAAHLGRFVARFAAVAHNNPYAWDRSGPDAATIATPSATNRMVGSPYTKLMVSNEQVDMAAAFVVMSIERAQALGISSDRFVFPLSSARGEAPAISSRFTLGESVLARGVRAELETLSPYRPVDAAWVDVYSCFPSAVQIQAHELGLGSTGDLTVTGGMRFSGGPWCAYSMHGIAALVERLRNDAGALGCLTANGGAISKLVVTMLSSTPSPAFVSASAQARIDRFEQRPLAERFTGVAHVESYTVMHGRGGVADHAVIAARTDGNERAWGMVRDASELAAIAERDLLGLPVAIAADGTAHLEP